MYEHPTVPQFLGDLNACGIKVRDGSDKLLYLEGIPSDSQRAALQRREAEILAHYRASPGREIDGYPPENKNRPIKFQELLIDDQKKQGRLVEQESGCLRWLSGTSDERMHEIVRELAEIEVLPP